LNLQSRSSVTTEILYRTGEGPLANSLMHSSPMRTLWSITLIICYYILLCRVLSAMQQLICKKCISITKRQNPFHRNETIIYCINFYAKENVSYHSQASRRPRYDPLVKLFFTHDELTSIFHCAHCTCDTFCQNNVSSLVTLKILFISRKKLIVLQMEPVSVNHCRMLNLTAETTFFA
jgi:hypothetical protein